jgi:hypothetical protein
VFNKNFTFRVSSHVSLREREEVMQINLVNTMKHFIHLYQVPSCKAFSDVTRPKVRMVVRSTGANEGAYFFKF